VCVRVGVCVCVCVCAYLRVCVCVSLCVVRASVPISIKAFDFIHRYTSKDTSMDRDWTPVLKAFVPSTRTQIHTTFGKNNVHNEHVQHILESYRMNPKVSQEAVAHIHILHRPTHMGLICIQYTPLRTTQINTYMVAKTHRILIFWGHFPRTWYN